MPQSEMDLDLRTVDRQPSSAPASFSRMWLFFSFGVALTIFLGTTPYMGLASLAYFFMVGGLIQRKQRRTHVKLMSTAMLLDLGMVLTLEFQRSAIGTAMGMKLGLFQQAHIVASSLALLLYFPVLYLGFQQWRNFDSSSRRARQAHKWLGIFAFILRTLGFILMFSLLSHVRFEVGAKVNNLQRSLLSLTKYLQIR